MAFACETEQLFTGLLTVLTRQAVAAEDLVIFASLENPRHPPKQIIQSSNSFFSTFRLVLGLNIEI
jgi:hypothetical protein